VAGLRNKVPWAVELVETNCGLKSTSVDFYLCIGLVETRLKVHSSEWRVIENIAVWFSLVLLLSRLLFEVKVGSYKA